MDIDQLMYTAVSKDNDSNELKGFIQSQGARQSANEHLVPEMLFDDPNTTEKEAQGISAVKALQIASTEGQTIYTITKDNYNQVLPKLNHSSDVMRDVANAVNAGKEVIISERQVMVFGWYGTGYIVLDPDTGTRGYLIDGGKNGGILLVLTGIIAAAISLFLIISTFWTVFTPLIALLSIGGLILWSIIWKQFICLPNKLNKLNDEEAHAELNAQVAMMVLGAFGSGIFGKLFASEGVVGTSFSLMVNDISLGLVLSNFPWSKLDEC